MGVHTQPPASHRTTSCSRAHSMARRGVGKLVLIRVEDWLGAPRVQRPLATPSVSTSSLASASTSAGVFLLLLPPPLPGTEMGQSATATASGVDLPSPSTSTYPPSPPWAHAKAQVQPNSMKGKQEPQDRSIPVSGLSISYAHSPVKMEDVSRARAWLVEKEEATWSLAIFWAGTRGQRFVPEYFDVHPLHPGWDAGQHVHHEQNTEMDWIFKLDRRRIVRRKGVSYAGADAASSISASAGRKHNASGTTIASDRGGCDSKSSATTACPSSCAASGCSSGSAATAPTLMLCHQQVHQVG